MHTDYTLCKAQYGRLTPLMFHHPTKFPVDNHASIAMIPWHHFAVQHKTMIHTLYKIPWTHSMRVLDHRISRVQPPTIVDLIYIYILYDIIWYGIFFLLIKYDWWYQFGVCVWRCHRFYSFLSQIYLSRIKPFRQSCSAMVLCIKIYELWIYIYIYNTIRFVLDVVTNGVYYSSRYGIQIYMCPVTSTEYMCIGQLPKCLFSCERRVVVR